MPEASGTSDLRALAAHVILVGKTSSSRSTRVPGTTFGPCSRHVGEGTRLGLIVGLGLGLTSTGGVLTPSMPHDPEWLGSFVAFTALGAAVGALAGGAIGVGVRRSQRRQLDRDLAHLVDQEARGEDSTSSSNAARPCTRSNSPKTDEAEAVLSRTLRLLEPLRPSYVSVTYGAGGDSPRANAPTSWCATSTATRP